MQPGHQRPQLSEVRESGCHSYGLSGVATAGYRATLAQEALPGGTKTSSP